MPGPPVAAATRPMGSWGSHRAGGTRDRESGARTSVDRANRYRSSHRPASQRATGTGPSGAGPSGAALGRAALRRSTRSSGSAGHGWWVCARRTKLGPRVRSDEPKSDDRCCRAGSSWAAPSQPGRPPAPPIPAEPTAPNPRPDLHRPLRPTRQPGLTVAPPQM